MNIKLIKHAIASSTSFYEVLERLGFKRTNTTQRNNIRQLIVKHKIDISHFNNRSRTRNHSRWGDTEKIKIIVKQSKSIGTFLENFGLKNIGSNYRTAQKYLTALGIDTSHFTRTSGGSKKGFSLNEILSGQYPFYKTRLLKKRLIQEGIKENKCELCGQLPLWNGKPLTLHLDHIDGNNTNHRLDNLRLLCPNCHTQTSTYCRKKVS